MSVCVCAAVQPRDGFYVQCGVFIKTAIYYNDMNFIIVCRYQ